MRIMTSAMTVLAFASLHVASLDAQGKKFEGTVTFHTVVDEDQGTFTYSIKGSKARFEMKDASMPMVMLLDLDRETMAMIMEGENMYMEFPIDDEDASEADQKMPDPVKTDRNDQVAGRSCEIWTLDDPEERKTYEMCVARDMGSFMQTSNPMGGRSSPAWEAELRKGGMFPLRVIETSGGKSQQILLVTKIEEKKLDDVLFAVPSGMKKMEMPPGMGRRPR